MAENMYLSGEKDRYYNKLHSISELFSYVTYSLTVNSSLCIILWEMKLWKLKQNNGFLDTTLSDDDDNNNNKMIFFCF